MIKEQIVRIETDGNETKAEVAGELVRCRDCTWHGENYCNNLNVWGFKDGDFCSFRRRKETENEHNL